MKWVQASSEMTVRVKEILCFEAKRINLKKNHVNFCFWFYELAFINTSHESHPQICQLQPPTLIYMFMVGMLEILFYHDHKNFRNKFIGGLW